MKKVFSLEKFKEWETKHSFGTKEIILDCSWAKECDGLTYEEIKKLGYSVSGSWMIEVEEKQKN